MLLTIASRTSGASVGSSRRRRRRLYLKELHEAKQAAGLLGPLRIAAWRQPRSRCCSRTCRGRAIT